MWASGNVDGYKYEVKSYGENSMFGINNGRISKLFVQDGSRVVASYERGWDVIPSNIEDSRVVDQIIRMYN